MNETQRERLRFQIAPDHECSPYLGGCRLPHYWHNHSSPRYLVAWPVRSVARRHADDVREARDWGGA